MQYKVLLYVILVINLEGRGNAPISNVYDPVHVWISWHH